MSDKERCVKKFLVFGKDGKITQILDTANLVDLDKKIPPEIMSRMLGASQLSCQSIEIFVLQNVTNLK